MYLAMYSQGEEHLYSATSAGYREGAAYSEKKKVFAWSSVLIRVIAHHLAMELTLGYPTC